MYMSARISVWCVEFFSLLIQCNDLPGIKNLFFKVLFNFMYVQDVISFSSIGFIDKSNTIKMYTLFEPISFYSGSGHTFLINIC